MKTMNARVSFCDALPIALMKANKIKRIYSFDSDFDLVNGVERVFLNKVRK